MRRTGDLIPRFTFETLNGGVWGSRSPSAGMFRLLVIYRGMWCPFCKEQLQELNALHDSFTDAGVTPVAVSADTRARAEISRNEYALDQLRIGYEMPIGVAREMGVFISAGIKSKEMPLFCEPACFLLNAENQIQAAWIASNAFARTRMREVRRYIGFLTAHPDRAPRGSG